MRVGVAVIGRNHWDDLTVPFMESVWEHEHIGALPIDAGSEPPYSSDGVVVPVGPVSYAEAMNAACDLFALYDWLIICNNDVLCTGPFVDMLYELEPGLYGGRNQRRVKPNFYGHRLEYLTGDITGLHRSAWEQIGPYDEQFIGLGGCEDIDYSLRAEKLGLLKDAVLPFKHLGLHHRKRRPGYRAEVDHNRMVLLGKLEAGEYD